MNQQRKALIKTLILSWIFILAGACFCAFSPGMVFIGLIFYGAALFLLIWALFSVLNRLVKNKRQKKVR